MAKRDCELTEAEWVIIQVVWEHEPCAAPTVQEELVDRTQWTYSTVKTLMDRMVRKGLLKPQRVPNLILYRCAVSRADAQQGELTGAEWEIIQVVWEHQPCAAPTVQEELADRPRWTHNTVKTLMDGMVGKGWLKTQRPRNLILYRSAVSRADAQQGELMRAVKRAFGGAFTPMMQFMLDSDALSPEEIGELETMIRKKRRRQKIRAKR